MSGNLPTTNLTNLNTSLTGSIASDKATNYISSETGTANTLAGALLNVAGEKVTLAEGLRILVKSANALQSGANTFNLNAGGTKAIVSPSGRNLKTVWAAGSMLDMVYDGTSWVLINADTMIS